MRKYDYHNSIGFTIKSTAKAFDNAFDQQLRSKVGITVAQSRVIGTLMLLKNGMTQKEIADRIGIEAPTIVPIIDRLEEQEIVERRPDPNDRRNNRIFLTGKSEGKWELIIEHALELEKASRQGISEEELEITKKTLGRITQNIAAFYSVKADQTESRAKEDDENGKNSIQIRKQLFQQVGSKQDAK